MKKAIILFALLLSSMHIMAQAYEFETEENIQNGTRNVSCDTKELVKLSDSSPDIGLSLQDYYDEETSPQIFFHLFKYAKDPYKNSIGVANGIRKLAYSIPKDASKDVSGKGNITIIVYLSNGDILRGTNCGHIVISSTERYSMESLDSVGMCSAYLSISHLKSSYIPREMQTKENLKVICQQLRTYDIVKIEVDGISFDVSGLHSAATFDAMFNTLAAKTGKGHLYRSPSTSSSSSSSASTPSATAEIGYVCILSDGEVYCRLDNVLIEGAKGKEVVIWVEFDDVNTEKDAIILLDKVTPIYDGTSYKSLVLHKNVNDGYQDFPQNGGRFSVEARFFTESEHQGREGHGREMDNIGITTKKYVNIFREQSGAWRSY